LNPDQLIKEAQTAYKQKKYLVAATAFETAAQVYSANGEEMNAAEMRNNSSVAFLQANNPQAALSAVQGTEQVFAKDGDIKRQALALGNTAAALEALGRLDEAATIYEESANLLKQINETDLRASVMQALSTIQLRLGRQLEAVVTMQSGLEDIKRPNVTQKLAKKILQSPINMLRPK
jgi:tetratricopeptide (TPR) repeat protein